MKPAGKARGPRPGSIVRVEGLSYGDLDDHLGYVLRRAQLAAFEVFQHSTAGMDITPPRYTALTIVGANPGLSQSMLGAALGTARSGAMMLVDWLEDRGLAERRRLNGDGRAWGLHLTARGKALLAKIRRRILQDNAAFASRLDPRELSLLKKLLEKLTG
jgi:DNA-binding MarR family transcriptional regulator